MIISRKRMDEEVNRRVEDELARDYLSIKLCELQKAIDELWSQAEKIREEHERDAERIRKIGKELDTGIANMIGAINLWSDACKSRANGPDGDDVLVWTESAKKE